MHSTGPRFPGQNEVYSPQSTGPKFPLSYQASPKNSNCNMSNPVNDRMNSKPYTPASATAALTKDLIQPRLRIVTDMGQMPTPTVQSMTVPSRDMSQPSNRYAQQRQMNDQISMPRTGSQSPHSPMMSPGLFTSSGPRSVRTGGPRLSPFGSSSEGFSNPPQLSPYQHRGGRRVNSRAEAKASNVINDFNAPPLSYVGNSYAHVPNAPNRPYLPLPESPTIPQVVPMLDRATYRNSPQLNNRLASGQILGAPPKRYAPTDKVPNLPEELPEDPLGPDNPYRDIDETWTACWDNEASAVYYYNKQSGEATWLPPEK